MSRPEPQANSAPHLVYGVTSGVSAFALLRGQLSWFAEHGWAVSLVTTPDEQTAQAIAREGVPLYGIAMTRSITPVADFRALIAWIRYLARTRPQAVNASTPKAGLLGQMAALLTRVRRRLYVVRGLRLEGAKGPTGALLWFMEWITMRLATDVVFVSRSLAEEAQRRRLISPGRAWLIGSGSSNGVDAAAIAQRCAQTEPSELRTALGIPASAFVAGFVGRVTPDKGVATLVGALTDPRIDPRAHLLVVGDVEDEAVASALDALRNRVTVVDWTDDPWGYLPAIDALCLPTKREGFPNVVLEAAAVGIPAIVTNATGAVDSVVDGATGFVIEIGDAQALAERINTLASDPGLAADLGRAARTRTEEEFAPERIWTGLDGILRRRGDSADVRRI